MRQEELLSADVIIGVTDWMETEEIPSNDPSEGIERTVRTERSQKGIEGGIDEGSKDGTKRGTKDGIKGEEKTGGGTEELIRIVSNFINIMNLHDSYNSNNNNNNNKSKDDKNSPPPRVVLLTSLEDPLGIICTHLVCPAPSAAIPPHK